MAYHTVGSIRRRAYPVSNPSSATAAVFAVPHRMRLNRVLHAVCVNQTASAGSWTASLNGSQITGLSSVAVTTGAVGETTALTTGTPTSETFLKIGDIFSVVGSSVTASCWTLDVDEF